MEYTGSNEGIKSEKNQNKAKPFFSSLWGMVEHQKKATVNPTATNPFFGPPKIGGWGKTGKNTNFFISSPIFLILVSFCSILYVYTYVLGLRSAFLNSELLFCRCTVLYCSVMYFTVQYGTVKYSFFIIFLYIIILYVYTYVYGVKESISELRITIL